jgi:uncharacterized protein
MDVTPLIPPDQKVIQSYTEGRFRISGEIFETPVIVGAGFVQPWNIPAGLTAIAPEDADQFQFLSGKIDVLLIGTGATATFLMPAIRQAFKDKGLPVEVMDTGAACRTFNVLSAEGRRVAAALVPVP